MPTTPRAAFDISVVRVLLTRRRSGYVGVFFWVFLFGFFFCCCLWPPFPYGFMAAICRRSPVARKWPRSLLFLAVVGLDGFAMENPTAFFWSTGCRAFLFCLFVCLFFSLSRLCFSLGFHWVAFDFSFLGILQNGWNGVFFY